MNTSTSIAIYLPLIIIFVSATYEYYTHHTIMKTKRKRKGGTNMSSELIKNHIGRQCNISMGGFSASYEKAKIIEVEDNWMKIEKRGKISLLNIDFIQTIKILPYKE